MRKIRTHYLFLGLLLFMVLGKTTSVSANEAMTNVNGESQGQMSVTGTLVPPKTSESEEEVPNKEEPKSPTPTEESTQKTVIPVSQLPKTGESVNPFIGLVGLLTVFIAGQLVIRFNKKEEI